MVRNNDDIISVISALRMSEKNVISQKRHYIQIGAGAGDRDSRAGNRDGFTEIIKRLSLNEFDNVALVEPNPHNIESLKLCWEGYKNIQIFQLGITEKDSPINNIPFYYSELDSPHFQVGSFDPLHVLKHYPQENMSTLRCISINAVDLTSFLKVVANGDPIMLLALDIEGIDSEIILETDFSKINLSLLSFEHLHLGDKLHDVIKHLEACGFKHAGVGVDHNGYDLLYYNAG